jgi:putative DNA primase/helicase
MKMILNDLANKLHADINGPFLNIQGPGHSKNDRSLGILFNSYAPNGFWVHSLAGDDPAVCRKHVLKLLAKITKGDAVEIELEQASANDAERQKRIALALLIWQEAQP